MHFVFRHLLNHVNDMYWNILTLVFLIVGYVRMSSGSQPRMLFDHEMSIGTSETSLNDGTLFGWNPQWTISDESSQPCLEMSGTFIVTTITMNVSSSNQPNKNVWIVPKDANASGTCNSALSDYKEITLSWQDSASELSNSMSLVFVTNFYSEWQDFNVSAAEYVLNNIKIVLHTNDTTFEFHVDDFGQFTTPVGSSYICHEEQVFLLSNRVQLTFNEISFWAFGDTKKQFECVNVNSKLGNTAATIIAVGLSAGVIIILLVIVIAKLQQSRRGKNGLFYKNNLVFATSTPYRRFQ